MTEYDYSPAAVERYHQKLAEIGQWRDTTAQIRQKDPNSPATPAYPTADLPRSKSSRRRTRSSDRDDYSDNRGRDDSSKHHRRRSTRDPPPPPLPSPLDRSRSVGPRPRTAPPRGDIYGLQQPPPASQFYPGPAPVQPYYPVPAGPGYMSAPPYPQQTQHTRSRSTSHAPAPAPPPPPQPTRTRSYSFAPPPQQVQPPLRSNSYPYTQPQQQQNGGKGYVYHPVPVPAYPPPGYASAPGPPPSGYASAPQLVQVNPGLFNQPVPMRSPTKEVPLLKRVFGFGGGKSRDGSSSRSKSRDGRSPRRGDSY